MMIGSINICTNLQN